ncbi:TPR repeat-containing protein DDB_G0287407-like [Haliotis asinina]|uniref:TPR repeat-containing protein DDB_G0287407-like n=1 Tax=Haliotis asinina TaxID=109174 RepID=UPI0035321A05
MACAAPIVSPSKPAISEVINVKLFITSYTDEFFTEREIIRKEILPEVRAWCEQKKLNLIEHAVKWGGRHPDRREVSELERAQTSIENCYYNNIMPLFINITSESIGWVPMWGEYADEVIEDYIEAYGLLVEDLQVLYGAYREDNLNSIFLIRNDSFLESVCEDEKKYFVQRTSASEKICGPHDKISQKFPSHRIKHYKCEYKGTDHKKRPQIKLADELKQEIIDFLKQRVAYDYCGEEPMVSNHPDSFVHAAHRDFLHQKSHMVLGRNEVVVKIEDYILHEDKDVPLLLLGSPGCGKSSILCKAADVILTKVEKGEIHGEGGKAWHVFYHFVGAVPGSTSLEPMLKRLLREVEAAKDSSNMPKDLDATAQMCCSVLSNPNTRPLIIFIDAVNQFAEEQAARVLSWLPRKLAPQVRCIFSMIDNTDHHMALMSRETKPIELHIKPLDHASRQSMVCEMLRRYDKRLPASQLEELLNKQSSENPLWLSVACEELSLLEDADFISQTIVALPNGLLNLLEHLLTRLEHENGGNLLVATLCLLEASAAGLLECELRDILGDEDSLMPPSPYDEKEEKECSEKEKVKQRGSLSDRKWMRIFSTLRPFLRPYGDSKEGRLDFYHRALSKAVRKKYFRKGEAEEREDVPVQEDEDNNEGSLEREEKPDAFYWWHKKLADYFETVTNTDRKVEEYPYHLVCLDDKYRLAQCLCDWDIFDQLYNEEYSSQLLAYWRKVGPSAEMISYYETALSKFEEDESVNEESVSIQYEKVCRVVIQAGKHYEALELLKTAMKIEEIELGARPHRMVELYALMAEIYDEKLKLNDFVSPSQLPDLRKTIYYGRKSITIRKTLPGTYHKFKLSMSLMKLAFNMESWEACGGGPELTGSEALAEGNKYIDKALKIFQELNDMGHYAEALMTKGVLAPRGSMEQLKLYNQAMDLCMQMYGEFHILTSRLYINIGIVYEDNNDYKKAYEYFKKWARVSEEILGPDHPKTLRAKGVLRESRYKRIAQELGEWDAEEPEQDGMADIEEEEEENPDTEHNYDDTVGQVELVVSREDLPLDSFVDNVANGEAIHIAAESGLNVLAEVDSDDNNELLMNGYFDGEDRESINEEHTDSENFYDDNFEDYDEQYILHVDNGPVIEEFNVHLGDDDDDNDIVELASREIDDCDNRYASDGREDDDDDVGLHHRYNRS